MTDLSILRSLNGEIESVYRVLESAEFAGIVIRECSGYSDRDYYFIGATTEEKEKTGDPWLFTADSWGEFVNKFHLFFAGYSYCKEIFCD